MFSTAQMDTLHSLMDRIIPPDQDAGAWQAGVADYLTRQLAGDLRDALPTYQAGLDALDAEARARTGQAFSALPAGEQDARLREVEAGHVSTAWPIDPVHFFQMVVEHVAEGFYSDPGNGGNREAVAWQMIGFVPGRPEAAQP